MNCPFKFYVDIKVFKNSLYIFSYLFLIYYGIFRIISEFFRAPDAQIGYVLNLFSMGTILSFLMIIIGFVIYFFLNVDPNQRTPKSHLIWVSSCCQNVLHGENYRVGSVNKKT